MRRLILQPLMMIALYITVSSAQAQTVERLNYLVKLKGAVTLYRWMSLADAQITTEHGRNCAGQQCALTEVQMTSANHALLESLAPIRFLFRSVYVHTPPQSLVFEKRQNKSSKKYQPYGFKHSFSVRSGDGNSIDRYELTSSGEVLPPSVTALLVPATLPGMTAMVKKHHRTPVHDGALDRWALIQTLRSVALDDGYLQTFAGTDGLQQLTYVVTVEESVQLMTGKQQRACWKLSIIEESPDGKHRPPLYVWMSKERESLPLQLEMSSEHGRIRFELTSR